MVTDVERQETGRFRREGEARQVIPQKHRMLVIDVTADFAHDFLIARVDSCVVLI